MLDYLLGIVWMLAFALVLLFAYNLDSPRLARSGKHRAHELFLAQKKLEAGEMSWEDYVAFHQRLGR